jgi:hypothetical protein
MVYLIKTLLVLFLIAWLGFGAWLIFKYATLFGPHPDDPAESAGASLAGNPSGRLCRSAPLSQRLALAKIFSLHRLHLFAKCSKIGWLQTHHAL